MAGYSAPGVSFCSHTAEGGKCQGDNVDKEKRVIVMDMLKLEESSRRGWIGPATHAGQDRGHVGLDKNSSCICVNPSSHVQFSICPGKVSYPVPRPKSRSE